MCYQTAIIQTTIDNVKRYSAPESGPYFLAIFGDTDKMNQRWWMLTHSDNVVLSTFTGLSTVGNLYDTQNINWRTKTRTSEKETEIQANDPERIFFLVYSRQKGQARSVSHPNKSSCQDHLPLTPVQGKTKAIRGQRLKCCERQSEFNSQQQAWKKNNIIIKYIWPLNKSLWWTSLPDRDKRAIQESKRGL